MIQLRDGLRLALEPQFELRVLRERGWQISIATLRSSCV
jgi:hypothetical protein